MKRVIMVSGMHCTGCSTNLQRMLTKQPGVSHAEVNLESATATVEYDENIVSLEKLWDVVDNCGFTVEK